MVVELDGGLGGDGEAEGLDFDGEAGLVDFFEEAVAEGVVDGVEGFDDGAGGGLVFVGHLMGHRFSPIELIFTGFSCFFLA